MCLLVITTLKLMPSRNFEKSGVESAYRAGQARGCATQGIAGDEKEARRRGRGVIVFILRNMKPRLIRVIRSG
jgi:hypothetical protein